MGRSRSRFRSTPPPPPLVHETRAPRTAAWSAGLILLAWVHRLLFLASNQDRAWPFSIFYEGDAGTFFNHAVAIRHGESYDAGLPFHPPLFPWFLAFVQEVAGVGTTSNPAVNLRVKIILALLGSLPAGLLYALVRPYLGHGVALGAALLAIHHFGLSVVALAPVSESLFLTLLLGALLVWSRGFDHRPAAPGPGAAEPTSFRRRIGRAAVLGSLLGFLALTRAEGILAGVLLIVAMLPGRSGAPEAEAVRHARRRRFATAGVAAAFLALTLLPWTIRNHLRISEFNRAFAGRLAEPLPRFVPVTIYGPLNLALANHPGADGTFSREALPAGAHGASIDLLDSRHLEFVLHGDRMAWDWVRGHPSEWLALALRKLGVFFDALRLGFTGRDFPGGLTGSRRPVDVFVPDSPAGFLVTVPLLLAGLVITIRRPGPARSWSLLVLMLTAAGMATTVLFFGYARQALLLVPLWLAWIAAAIAALLGRIPAWADPRIRRRALVALILVLLAVDGTGAFADRSFDAEGESMPGTNVLNPDRPLRLRPR